MAQMLLWQMEASGADFKAVLWAHNGHVTRGELRYLGVRELRMVGHPHTIADLMNLSAVPVV